MRRLFASTARALVLCAALMASGCSADTETVSAPVHCTGIAPGTFLAPSEPVKTHNEFAKEHFRKRLQEFSDAPLGCGQIVMLGDSMTELNDWARAIPGKAAVRNRGVSGDTSDGILARMDEIVASRPKAVFLLIGTNDIWTSNSPEVTVANISAAVDRIRVQSPNTMVFVQTVFPLRLDAAPHDKVRAINALLKVESGKARFVLLDTYKLMADRDGLMKAAYTDDGLHPNAKGNRVWAKLVSATMRRNRLHRRDS